MPDKSRRQNDFAASGVGALVLGGDFNGLGIVRSLGRHGVPVGVVDDEHSIAPYSRYTTFTHRVSSLRNAKETVEALLQLGRRKKLHGWVLYPTRDENVAALSESRAELAEIFRVPTPSWQTTNWLWDKRKTYQLAQEVGIPTPRTWYPRDIDDLEQLYDRFPLVLKPAIKEHFIYATRDKAWRVDSPAQLRRLFCKASLFLPPGEIMIQDLIPGNGDCQYAFCCLFKQGKALASLVVNRRRQHPADFGRASTYVETVEQPLVAEYAQRFLRAIDFYGLVEVEFKFDPRDGQYRLLDVNGRTWGYHTIGRRAGLDFPYLLFTDQLDGEVGRATGKPGIRWIRLMTDLPSGMLGILQGELGLGSYVRSLFHCDEEAVFSKDDPLPGLAEVALVPYLIIKRGF
jgi:predicted ATP-grasp superfamily ATP-dependent carboligase